MSKYRCCGSCKHSEYDKQSEDFVCNNPESENFAEWIEFNCKCQEWEDKNA